MTLPLVSAASIAPVYVPQYPDTVGSLIGIRTVLAPEMEYNWPTTWLPTAVAEAYVSEALRPETYSTPLTKLSLASAQLTPLSWLVAAPAGEGIATSTAASVTRAVITL